MIVLHIFGKQQDMIDPSPFVTKAHTLLRFAGLPYETTASSISKAPRGKLPAIVDDGVTIADSTFIRLHIETKYGFDFDAGLDARERAIAWSAEKLIEDHLFWIWAMERWTYKPDYEKGPAQYFNGVPAFVRPLVERYYSRKLAATRHAQGIGRYTDEERKELSKRGLNALAAMLADKPFLMGDTPCGADASLFASVNVLLSPAFTSPSVMMARSHANLVSYSTRLAAQYFPDYQQKRG